MLMSFPARVDKNMNSRARPSNTTMVRFRTIFLVVFERPYSPILAELSIMCLLNKNYGVLMIDMLETEINIKR